MHRREHERAGAWGPLDCYTMDNRSNPSGRNGGRTGVGGGYNHLQNQWTSGMPIRVTPCLAIDLTPFILLDPTLYFGTKNPLII